MATLSELLTRALQVHNEQVGNMNSNVRIGSLLRDIVNFLDTKQDKEAGKGLSANDFSNVDKANLTTIVNLLNDNPDNVLNTISEVFKILESYPEGVKVVDLLGGKVDKGGYLGTAGDLKGLIDASANELFGLIRSNNIGGVYAAEGSFEDRDFDDDGAWISVLLDKEYAIPTSSDGDLVEVLPEGSSASRFFNLVYATSVGSQRVMVMLYADSTNDVSNYNWIKSVIESNTIPTRFRFPTLLYSSENKVFTRGKNKVPATDVEWVAEQQKWKYLYVEAVALAPEYIVSFGRGDIVSVRNVEAYFDYVQNNGPKYKADYVLFQEPSGGLKMKLLNFKQSHPASVRVYLSFEYSTDQWFKNGSNIQRLSSSTNEFGDELLGKKYNNVLFIEGETPHDRQEKVIFLAEYPECDPNRYSYTELGNTGYSEQYLFLAQRYKADIIGRPYVNAAASLNAQALAAPDVLFVCTHYGNADNQRHDITPDSATFLKTVACVARREDVEPDFNDNTENWTSYGFGAEFNEDTRNLIARYPNATGLHEWESTFSSTNPEWIWQSPAVAIVAAKFRKIKDACPGFSWDEIREAARSTASKADNWNIYWGFGTINVEACINELHYREAALSPSLAKLYREENLVDSRIRFEDMDDNVPIRKKDLIAYVQSMINSL